MSEINVNTPNDEKRQSHFLRNLIAVIFLLLVVYVLFIVKPFSSKESEQVTNNTDIKTEENITNLTPDVNAQEQKKQESTNNQNTPTGAGQNQVNSSLSATGITFDNSDQYFLDNGQQGYTTVVPSYALVSEPVGVMGVTTDGRYYVREAEVNMVRPSLGAKLKFKGTASVEGSEWMLKPTELINGYYIYQSLLKSPVFVTVEGVNITEFCFQFTTASDKPLRAGHIPHLFKYAGAKVGPAL